MSDSYADLFLDDMPPRASAEPETFDTEEWGRLLGGEVRRDDFLELFGVRYAVFYPDQTYRCIVVDKWTRVRLKLTEADAFSALKQATRREFCLGEEPICEYIASLLPVSFVVGRQMESVGSGQALWLPRPSDLTDQEWDAFAADVLAKHENSRAVTS